MWRGHVTAAAAAPGTIAPDVFIRKSSEPPPSRAINMEAVHLPAGGAGTAGRADLTADCKPQQVLKQKLPDGGEKVSNVLTVPSSHTRISFLSGSVTGRLVQDCNTSHVASISQMCCTEISALNRNLCCGNSSITGRRGRKVSRSGSNIISDANKKAVSENNVLSDKLNDDQYHLSSRLCDCFQKPALFPLSIISSARLFSSSYHRSQQAPSLARRLSNRMFLLILFCCVLHGASSAELVVRASARRSSCLQTNDRTKALLADVVIEGKVRRALPANSGSRIFDHYVSIRKKILKGKELVARGQKKPKRLRIGRFMTGKSDLQNCVASVRIGRTYFFYLRDIGDRKGLRFEMMAMPSKRTKKLGKSLRDILCDRCGKFSQTQVCETFSVIDVVSSVKHKFILPLTSNTFLQVAILGGVIFEFVLVLRL